MFPWAQFPVYLAVQGAAVKDSGERRKAQSPGLAGGIWVRATVPSVPFPLDTGISGRQGSTLRPGKRSGRPFQPQLSPCPTTWLCDPETEEPLRLSRPPEMGPGEGRQSL